MYLTYNEGKSVAAERFKNLLLLKKVYKYMISISKNVFINKVDDIAQKYNCTYHSTIKIIPVDVKSNTFNNSSKWIKGKVPKFETGDIVRLSKYKKNQKEFRVEKVIIQKGSKLYVKWNGCNSSFNNWIDKKDIL